MSKVGVVMLLSLSYQRRLRMISEGGRVSHSWCTGVVNHGCNGLGGAGMEVVHGMHARQSQVVVVCWEMPENFPCAR